LTTTWKRFTFTTTLAATATEIAVRVRYSPSGTAGANDWMEVTGLQLELGSTATTFKRSNGAGGTIQGELAACQRYYVRQTAGGTGFRLGNLACDSTTVAEAAIPFPVQMRVAPSALETSGTVGDYSIRTAGASYTATGVTFLSANVFNITVNVSVASGLVAGAAGTLRPVNANAYLGWSAEL
jgi:hypothetical protein